MFKDSPIDVSEWGHYNNKACKPCTPADDFSVGWTTELLPALVSASELFFAFLSSYIKLQWRTSDYTSSCTVSSLKFVNFMKTHHMHIHRDDWKEDEDDDKFWVKTWTVLAIINIRPTAPSNMCPSGLWIDIPKPPVRLWGPPSWESKYDPEKHNIGKWLYGSKRT